MLVHTNSTLEDDRRSLMDHVSLLFTQYHELLTHALDDKEYYHSEEKAYVYVQLTTIVKILLVFILKIF